MIVLTAACEDSKPTNATVYAICDDAFEMRINGIKVLDCAKKALKEERVSLKKTDKITVKAMNFTKAYGFACIIKFDDTLLPPIATSMRNWKAYSPRDHNNWSDPNGMLRRKNVVEGTNQTWKNLMEAKLTIPCESIWSDPKDSTAYLYLDIIK